MMISYLTYTSNVQRHMSMLQFLALPVAYPEPSLHKNGFGFSAKPLLKDATESFVIDEQLYKSHSLPQPKPKLYQSVPVAEVISRRITQSTTEDLLADTVQYNLFH